MKNDVYLAGVGMTRFDRHLDKTYAQLGAMALDEVFKDAGMAKPDIGAVFFSNSFWGHFEGQHSIKGQCVLRPYGLLGLPIINVENACASGSTALYMAYLALRAEEFDAALCLGVEKLAHPDKALSLASYTGAFDTANLEDTFRLYDELSRRYEVSAAPDDGKGKSRAMEFYGVMARWHMNRYGTTQEQFAGIAVKNRFNGSLNPLAQWQEPVSLEEVIGDRVISYPLTRSMCSPVGDGAAAAILVSGRFLHKLKGPKPMRIRAIVHSAGTDKRTYGEKKDIGEIVSRDLYEKAGLGPEDIDIAELHDATACGELHLSESLGFTPEGTGGEFASSGKSALDGVLPINTSGGLISRGHPVGASGIGQIHELVTQMRGGAGRRQVPKDVRIAMAQNGGGILTLEEASMTITILEKV